MKTTKKKQKIKTKLGLISSHFTCDGRYSAGLWKISFYNAMWPQKYSIGKMERKMELSDRDRPGKRINFSHWHLQFCTVRKSGKISFQFYCWGLQSKPLFRRIFFLWLFLRSEHANHFSRDFEQFDSAFSSGSSQKKFMPSKQFTRI